MALHTLSDNVVAVTRSRCELYRLFLHHKGAGRIVALEHDEMVALGHLIAEVLEKERQLNKDILSTPQERTAYVVDVRHPLYGTHCRVGLLRPDGLYPLTVVDDPWHCGYAYPEQLGQEREEKIQ